MLRMKTQESFLDPIVMKLKTKGTSLQANYYFRSKHLIFSIVLYMLTISELLVVKNNEIVPKTYVLVYLFLVPLINFGKDRIM